MSYLDSIGVGKVRAVMDVEMTTHTNNCGRGTLRRLPPATAVYRSLPVYRCLSIPSDLKKKKHVAHRAAIEGRCATGRTGWPKKEITPISFMHIEVYFTFQCVRYETRATVVSESI